jgi:hypothetical protein
MYVCVENPGHGVFDGRKELYFRARPPGQRGNYADRGCVRTRLLGEERDSDSEAMPLRADRMLRIVTENGMSGEDCRSFGGWNFPFRKCVPLAPCHEERVRGAPRQVSARY